MAALLAVLAAWNARALPNPRRPSTGVVRLVDVLAELLRKPGIWKMMLFIIVFRLGEGQTQIIGPLFLAEARDKGGLGLSCDQVGLAYGTVGTAAFLVGSVLGGYFTSWWSLRRAMPVLVIAMMVPRAVFYALSMMLPTQSWTISAAIGLEMLAYGFGFVGMVLFIMQAVAPGRYQTAHYALGSGVMQLGFVLAKTVSGDIQLNVGYPHFFAWTFACGLLPLALFPWIPMPSGGQARTTSS